MYVCIYIYISGQNKQINVVVWFIDKTVLYEKARDSGQKANYNRVLHAIQGNFYMPVHYHWYAVVYPPILHVMELHVLNKLHNDVYLKTFLKY